MRFRQILPAFVLASASVAHYRNLKRLSSIEATPPEIPGDRGIIEINGHTVGYRLSRRGGPRFVVLIHGWGSSGDATWLNFMKKSDFSFVSLDLPGYGDSAPLKNTSVESTAHLMNMALRLLSVDNPLLVAHSYGGLIAGEMVRQEPEFFKKVIMVSSTASFRKFPLFLYARIAPHLLGKKSPIGLHNTVRSMNRDNPSTASLTAWRWSQSPDARIMRLTSKAALRKIGACKIDGETSWIIPENDRYIHPRLQASSAKPGDSVVTVPSASHGFIESDPSVLIDKIKREMLS